MERIIWSDTYFWSNEEVEESEEFIKESCEIYDEYDVYMELQYQNGDCLDDERKNLNINLENEIIIFGDLGLWDGRVHGYKVIKSGNIADCLYSECDYAKWYCDKYNFKFKGVHHDGCNYYTYRVLRKDVTEEQKENFYEAIIEGRCNDRMIRRYTKSIRPYIAEVYGWN